MPFLRAGFNARSRDTGIRGWTRHVDDEKRRFAVAELRVFVPGGDYFWLDAAERPRFLSWGEQVVLGSIGIDLPYEWQGPLPKCNLETRAVYLPETGWRQAA